MLLNSEPPASPNPKSPMLKALNPLIVWSPAMPMLALALPIPAQSTGMVWNFTWVKPTSSSLMAVGDSRSRNRAETSDGNLVARERLTGDGIPNRDGNTGEVALPKRRWRYGSDQLAWPIAKEALVIAEEEDLVPGDWAADGGAENV